MSAQDDKNAQGPGRKKKSTKKQKDPGPKANTTGDDAKVADLYTHVFRESVEDDDDER